MEVYILDVSRPLFIPHTSVTALSHNARLQAYNLQWTTRQLSIGSSLIIGELNAYNLSCSVSHPYIIDVAMV